MDTEEIRRSIAIFASASSARSILEFLVTIVPLLICWNGMVLLYSSNHLILVLLLSLFTSALNVRAIMILHDCGHRSFFKNGMMNDITGRLIGVFTLIPFEYWRRSHALHHAGSGNIERRGLGDVPTMMVSEYRSLGPDERRAYQMLRNPYFLFGFASFFAIYMQTRIPTGLTRQGWRPWISTMCSNLLTIILLFLLSNFVGWAGAIYTILPVLLLTSSSIVWLNFVQHSFEGSYFWPDSEWNFSDAALYASSNYVLPQPLAWFSANFGVHHVHHLNTRIPFYRLPEVLKAFPALDEINRISGHHDFCISRSLWDEARRKFVSPQEAVFTEDW